MCWCQCFEPGQLHSGMPVCVCVCALLWLLRQHSKLPVKTCLEKRSKGSPIYHPNNQQPTPLPLPPLTGCTLGKSGVATWCGVGGPSLTLGSCCAAGLSLTLSLALHSTSTPAHLHQCTHTRMLTLHSCKCKCTCTCYVCTCACVINDFGYVMREIPTRDC